MKAIELGVNAGDEFGVSDMDVEGVDGRPRGGSSSSFESETQGGGVAALTDGDAVDDRPEAVPG